PPELVFQDFIPHESCEMVLSLINKDEAPQTVKVSMESSPCFQLVCPNEVYRSVPPGTSVDVHVRFTPEKNKNYVHQLLCTTARERIVVPLRAVATRGNLDLPTHLDFQLCVVNCKTQKTLVVCNTGTREARFCLSTEGPFSVVPATGVLGIGNTMEVTVAFYPPRSGEHSGGLLVSYNTGERTALRGDAKDVDIVFSTNCADFGKAFITLSWPMTVTIENRSGITASFQWKRFSSLEEDNMERKRMHDMLTPSKEDWVENLVLELEEEKQDMYEDRIDFLQDQVQKKRAKVLQNPLLFSDDYFTIEPLVGEVGPYSSVEIKVTFLPVKSIQYRAIAYCDISGREIRVPLTIKGQGRGPWAVLSYDTLNLGKILVNTPHVYEVKLINKGPIEAPFDIISGKTNVGKEFKFVPEQGVVAVGEAETIRIFFRANIARQMAERYLFCMTGCPKPERLIIRGCVMEPAFAVSEKDLHYGNISFGFPKTKKFYVTSLNPVSVKFKFRMSEDGSQPSVHSTEQIADNTHPSWTKGPQFQGGPQEFKITPSEGIIHPQARMLVQVTVCSNTVTEYNRLLFLDAVDIRDAVADVVITARCDFPRLRVFPTILWYDKCRLNEPYEKTLSIVNATLLHGCYALLPQERKEGTPVFYSSTKPCGIVPPYTIGKIPLTIKVQALGAQNISPLVAVFGDERHPLVTNLQSIGCLAEIFPDQLPIDYGFIPALHPTPKIVRITYKGAAPIKYRIAIEFRPHCFVIEPSEGVIPPQTVISVTITAILNDTGDFNDNVQLYIEGHGLLSSFPLIAFSLGTTILIDKPFYPLLNLKYQF
ncbi:HYDIN protein, partial [Malurus elegans]|nr:HYDIN protein [Malurus elegans]